MKQGYGKTTTISQSQGANANKIRQMARRYVDALSTRLQELQDLAKQAENFTVYTATGYPRFRKLCAVFTKRSQEFQGLSSLIGNVLSQLPERTEHQQEEKAELEQNFQYLQVPILTQIITTSNQLQAVWRDRLEKKIPLPIDVQESFIEMSRIVQDAKFSLGQPEYAPLVDEKVLSLAEDVLKCFDVLINEAPPLTNFDEINQNKENKF